MTTQNHIEMPKNPRWMSETAICQQFAVGSLRLHEFSSRGDLACRFGPRGEVLYDAYAVEGLFRMRSVALSAPANGLLGQVGQLRLGAQTSSTVIQPRSKVRSLSAARTRAA